MEINLASKGAVRRIISRFIAVTCKNGAEFPHQSGNGRAECSGSGLGARRAGAGDQVGIGTLTRESGTRAGPQ